MKIKQTKFIASIFLLLITLHNAAANTVVYRVYPNVNSTTIGSLPASDSSYYYSGAYGNSFGYSQIQYFPVIVSNYPTAYWVPVNNGVLLPNAIVSSYVNGFPLYYCRVWINRQLYYGQFAVSKGCFISNTSPPFKVYQLLVH